MRYGRAIALPLLALLPILAAPAQLPGQNPEEQAWAELRAHGVAAQEMFVQYDTIMRQLADRMKDIPLYKATSDDLLALANLIHRQRDQVDTLWSSARGGLISNTLRNAQTQFGLLENLSGRFVQLAKQIGDAELEGQRLPQAERELTQYLPTFAGRFREVDRQQFEPMYNRITAFKNDCEAHQCLIKRFGDSIKPAIDAYYNQWNAGDARSRSRREKERSEMKAKADRLIVVFREWDARQPRVVAVAEKVQLDWRRIHVDTQKMAVLLAKPDYIADLPEFDSTTVVQTLAKIKGFLQTYR